MKEIKLILVLVLLAAGGSYAQRYSKADVDPVERAKKRTEKMKADLSLSDQQYNQLLAINKTQAEKMEAKRKAHLEEMKAKQAAMKVEREAYLTSLKGILTEEQFKKHEALMDAKKKEMKEKRNAHGKRGHSGKKP